MVYKLIIQTLWIALATIFIHMIEVKIVLVSRHFGCRRIWKIVIWYDFLHVIPTPLFHNMNYELENHVNPRTLYLFTPINMLIAVFYYHYYYCQN